MTAAAPRAPGGRRRGRARGPFCFLAGLTLNLAAATPVAAAPLLRAAEVTVVMTGPASCEVRAVYTIEGSGAEAIEYRLQAPEGVDVDLLSVGGAPPPGGAVVRRGATLAYTWSIPGEAAERSDLHYRVSLPEAGYRCPIWLPAVPTDGLSRAIRLDVRLPDGAVPLGGSHPALAWRGNRGETTLGHLPSFVRVPHRTAEYAPRGLEAWNLARAMDVVALGVLAVVTALWVVRQNRRSRASRGGDHAGSGAGRSGA